MSAPNSAKPDRYKLDSYNTYNYRWSQTYDACIWLRLFGVKQWDNLIVRELTPGLEDLDILDAGCATGRLIDTLFGAGAKKVSGVDLAPRILETARARLASYGMKGDLRTADVEERIPWASRSFDVVTMTGVLHHLSRPKDALSEIARVLRRPGRLVIVDVRFPSPLRQMFNLCLRIRPSAGDYYFYSPPSVVRMLAGLGWRRIESRTVSWSSFMITAAQLD
jgi:2-polyprenyl-3-methyl-5-hydroxy-6-metoxy-1,4-benzoquinol methylase